MNCPATANTDAPNSKQPFATRVLPVSRRRRDDGAGSNLRPVLYLAIQLAAFLFFLRPAYAANPPEITQDAFYTYCDINFFSPIGQSFTSVVDSPVSVEFRYLDVNAVDGPNYLTLNLLSGTGAYGTLLASSTITLPDGFTGYYGADFPSVSLSAGSAYTVLVVAPTERWAVGLWRGNAYPGGVMIQNGELTAVDLTFRVIPIPEPTITALILLTVAVLTSLGRREP